MKAVIKLWKPFFKLADHALWDFLSLFFLVITGGQGKESLWDV